MRVQSSVTAISWIPSEAIEGLSTRLPFDIGIAHYDAPLPDVIDDLEALRRADAFRFANELRAWIDVEDGLVVRYGQEGGGLIGATTLRLGMLKTTFAAVPYPDLRPAPEVTPTSVRFTQTAGGRTGVPAPRRVRGKPFALTAPTAWSTLALTINADGSSTHEVLGASPFPRHWIYGGDGRLVAKTGLIDFETWYREAHGTHSPWGDEDRPAIVTAVETELERQLSSQIMRQGAKPRIERLEEGDTLTRQGSEGSDLFVLLDGVLSVEVDGNEVGQVGPGAVLGERAVLEGGLRTSTLRAVTPCKVAVAAGADLDPQVLTEVSRTHRREDSPGADG